MAIVGMTSKANPMPHFQRRNQADGAEDPTPGGELHHRAEEDEPHEHREAHCHRRHITTGDCRLAAQTSWATVLCSTSSARCQSINVAGVSSAPRKQLVAVRVHPARGSEGRGFETGGVGDGELAARRGAGESRSDHASHRSTSAKRRMLGVDDLVEAAMLAGCARLLAPGTPYPLGRARRRRCRGRVAHGLHHVGLAVGMPS